MDYSFQQIMAERTVSELVIIVSTERFKYEKNAIEAAESEIEKRKINPALIHALKEKVQNENTITAVISAKSTNLQNRATNQIIDFIAIGILVTALKKIGILIFKLSEDIEPLIFVFAYIFYYVFMESKYQQTLGKFYTKTLVVTLNGKKSKIKSIIGRTLLRTIPYDIISFFFNKNGFHDSLSETRVIDIK